MTNLVGTIIGSRYQVLHKIGAGGMGAVYKALDRLTRLTVALKHVVRAEASSDTTIPATDETTSMRVALANEFQVLAGLQHPHIIRVQDYGFDDERQPYFTMSLLEGARPFTDAAQNLPDDGKIQLLSDMLQALAYLHQHGIIHRDLKPDNALVNAQGEVKVLDFGLAALRAQYVEDQGLSGTVAYMAPELLQGSPHSAASDLFAAGVMAHEVFVGRHPFRADGSNILYNILYGQIDLDTPELHPVIRMFIARLLARDPADRYAEAYDAIRDLSDAASQPILAETEAIRESFLQSAEFVGREQEMQILTDALDMTLAGHGGVWLIGGESGVGKSRLLDEVRIRGLVRGMLYLNGQGVEGGGLSYQLWREPLRRLVLSTELSDTDAAILDQAVPDINELIGRPLPKAPELQGQDGQQRLVETIAGVFRKQKHPIVIVLEDLQWAEESLLVLNQLMPHLAKLPILIVASYRSDERPNLPDMLPGAQHMKLGRLSDEGIADLSASMLGNAGRREEIVDLLRRETEGNAFFLVEVVRALAQEAGSLGNVRWMTLPQQVVAGGVQQVIENRLKRMPAYSRPLLNLAAIAGRELDIDLLHTLEPEVDLDSWLTICSNAVVLEVSGEQWRFVHDKLRQGVARGLSPDERRALHQRVAKALETLHAAHVDEYAAIIASHYQEAGDLEQALRWSVRGAEHAKLTYAPETAILCYQRALELWPQVVEQSGKASVSRVNLYENLGELMNWQARYPQALEHFTEMRMAAEAAGDIGSQASAWYGLARTQTYQGDVRAALESATRSEELAQQGGTPLAIAQALWMKGWTLFRMGSIPEARDLAERVKDIAEREKLASMLGNALNLLGTIQIVSGQYRPAAESFQGALDVFEQGGDRLRAMTIINNLGWLAETRGDYQTAFNRYRDALSKARESGHRDAEMVYLSNMGSIQVMLGQYDAAANDLRQVIYMAEGTGLSVLSETYRCLAEAYLYQGDPSEAVDAAQQALMLGREAASQDYIAAAFRVLGMIAAQRERPVPLADLETGEIKRYDLLACFNESLRIASENGLDTEKARTLKAWAQHELQRGDHAKGTQLWQESRDIFERLGAEFEVERMAALPKHEGAGST